MNEDFKLTEEELEYLFSGRRPRKKVHILPYVYGTALTVLFACLIFTIINFGSIKSKLIYWYQNEYGDNTVTQETTTVLPNQSKSAAQTNAQKPTLEQINNNYLTIKSINVLAPITWNVQNVYKLTSAGLQNGLIHIDKTAKPGEVGNVFITGHSSNYPWAKGNYNNIFALLDKLVIGDKIQLKYNNQDYLYAVRQIKVVQPTDTSVLQPTKDSVLTLMTCTPVGTSLRRLIVISDQIYPAPSTNKTSTQQQFDGKEIPAAR